MKIKVFIGLLACVLLAACAARDTSPPQNTRINQLNMQQSIPVRGIEILTTKTNLKRGETGIIVMRGRPGVVYTISATYNAGGKTMTSTQRETARADGVLTWNWFVAQGTSPGVYPLEISGGGDSYRTTYTVSQ